MTERVLALSFNEESGVYGLVELAAYRLTCALCPWRGKPKPGAALTTRSPIPRSASRASSARTAGTRRYSWRGERPMPNAQQQREEMSDARFGPTVHYVYILRLAGGTFYVGQTNDLVSRHAEHFIDAGAEATKGQRPELAWFSHTHDRRSAQQMEQRLQATLKRSPLEIEQIVARFNDLLDLVEGQIAYDLEMAHSLHHGLGVVSLVPA